MLSLSDKFVSLHKIGNTSTVNLFEAYIFPYFTNKQNSLDEERIE